MTNRKSPDRDYHAPRREREPYVREFHAIGFPMMQLAQMVDCNSVTVRRDLEACDLKIQNLLKTEVYANAFKRYAELECKKELTEFEKVILPRYIEWLDVKNMLRTLDCALMPQWQLRKSEYSEDVASEMSLIEAIFGDRNALETKLVFNRYLRHSIVAPGVIPESLEQVIHEVIWSITEETRRCIGPVVDAEELKETMRKILATLTSREERVIRLRFGIGHVVHSYEEVASDFEVTLFRIKQIEAKALRKLRHLSRLKRLKQFFLSLGNTTIQAEEFERERQELQTEVGELRTTIHKALSALLLGNGDVLAILEAEIDTEGVEINENLLKTVQELELSVRSEACLRHAGIQYIFQLVEKSEAEMLKTKNFGRKSLNEIKEILSDLGLALGMKLTPDVMSVIRHKLKK